MRLARSLRQGLRAIVRKLVWRGGQTGQTHDFAYSAGAAIRMQIGFEKSVKAPWISGSFLRMCFGFYSPQIRGGGVVKKKSE